MSTDELSTRLARIYAALDEVFETDLSKVPATVITTDTTVTVFQDFRSGLSDAQLKNRLVSLNYNLAHLKDHTEKWMKQNGVDRKQLEEFREQHQVVRIIEDLSNNDKHGYPPRNGRGKSGEAPNLININRVMRLRPGSEAGSGVAVRFTATGEMRSFGSGNAPVVVTGDVVDSSGVRIGDLYDLQNQALSAWEGMLRSLGVVV